MPSLWVRFARLNAPFLATVLREAAKQIELLEPGSPVFGTLAFHAPKGGFVQNPTVPDTQQPFTGTLSWLDAKGNPTQPAADEPLTLASDNEAVATVADNGDGSITVSLAGQLGAAVVSASLHNEAGEDILVQGTITVIASDAESGSIDFAV